MLETLDAEAATLRQVLAWAMGHIHGAAGLPRGRSA